MEKVKSKKEKIISIIGFIILLAVLTVILSLFFKPNNPMDYADKRMASGYRVYDEPQNTLDVLFLGHSAVFAGVSPMEIYSKYGFTSFDCSFALQMPWDSANFLKEILKKQSPKVVVMDVDSVFYDINREDIRKYYNEAIKQNKFPLLNNHVAWKDWFPQPIKRGRDYNKGFAVDYVGKKPYTGKWTFNQTDQRYPTTQEFIQGLDEVVRICKEQDIQLHLVEIPNKTRWTYSKYNTICDYAKKHGVPFTDFTQEEKSIGLDWTNDTKDQGDHLNRYGAIKMSNYLGKMLIEKYDLPDRRNDEQYAFWKEDFEQYKKRCGK